uniref:GDSL esterase/lipase n=1 Tax=Aegilops tauschii TaxID=37682 RepID=M8CU77_AEGTA
MTYTSLPSICGDFKILYHHEFTRHSYRSSVISISQQLEYFKEYKERLKQAKGQAVADEIIAEALYIFSIGTNDFFVNYYVMPLRAANQQLEYFKEYKERLKQAKGQAVADEIIAEALYIFSIGTNDFFVNYYVMPLRAAKYTPTEYATYLVGLAEDAVRHAYELGARKVMLSGIPPFGCVPAARTMNRDAPGECNEEYNRVARSYNAGVRDAVVRLGAELAGARVVYLDVYDVPSAIFADPSEYGFENVARGCCGTGLIETTVLCGMDEAFTCQDADKYVFFDSVHPSQRTYKLLAEEIIKTALQEFLV